MNKNLDDNEDDDVEQESEEDDDYDDEDQDDDNEEEESEVTPPPIQKKVKGQEAPKVDVKPTRGRKAQEPKQAPQQQLKEDKGKGKTSKKKDEEVEEPKTGSKKKTEPKQPKQTKPKVEKEKKVKEPNEEKEKKKTKKQLKEEEKEEKQKNQEIEDQKYFFNELSKENQKLASEELIQIAKESITNNNLNEEKLKNLITKYELGHPKSSLDFLLNQQKELQDTFQKEAANTKLCFQLFRFLNENLFVPTPCVQETMFFPNRDNETKLASQLRKAKKSIDVCVFAFTNDRFRDAILYAYEKQIKIYNLSQRGAKVRMITDDECSKFPGADIFIMGAKGIPCTMDKNEKVHMHNKFAIIDQLVLITGSFNWTTQAVQQNQENLIVIENQKLIVAYQAEFEKLWEQFAENRLSLQLCQQKVQEAEDQKKANLAKMNQARKDKTAQKKKNE